MKPFISNLFQFPVTRKEVLLRAKKLKECGLCLSFCHVLNKYNISHNYQYTRYFPKFVRKNALPFGANKDVDYWWEPYIWNTGRMDFLDWLIDQYKDDKTNLRKL